MCEHHSIDIDMHPEKKPRTPRSEQEKKQIINRLKRIEGQVRGLQKMVQDDRYCVDILIQISAIQAALKNTGYSLLERHTKSCVANAVKEGEGEHYIDELMKVIQQFSK
ncbi:DNA-binding FrmR family transcriptional regulator [Scopulibacillus daqui]|uniref:DNA-binding FrmR family transcriptional regulator n=1 Tax=Scopulibacillus daqui TaxID=1469162 RepID=A0ABS2Q2G2_9BACL|nr:metal-sensing transcriptional repressor [Scopulibacillus daqui]MBM7646035.1 DNA-binding FrmR family transcriptional regulator [Scopulibacillus daqui]